MAFQAKTDYCGLVESNVLAIRSSTENKSGSTYAPVGEDGTILAVEAYGLNAAPSCEYALQAALTKTAGAWQLGKLTSVGTGDTAKKYRLNSIKISTAANSPVKVSASAQLVEDGATESATNNLDVPALSLATSHVAQDVFSAFTHTNGNLIQCDADISGDVSTDTLVGDIISNGIGSGLITVSGTLLVSGSTEPTVEAATGWTLTKPLTCTNPETAYKQYTFELQKPLAKHTAST